MTHRDYCPHSVPRSGDYGPNTCIESWTPGTGAWPEEHQLGELIGEPALQGLTDDIERAVYKALGEDGVLWAVLAWNEA